MSVLKINSSGDLVKFNSRLRRWESVSISWSWDDIHPDHIDESRNNWAAYQEELEQK